MRARSSYRKPESSFVPWSSELKPLLPLGDSPSIVDAQLPALPPPRSNGSLIDEWYTLSTHIVPAASPRATPEVPFPENSNAPTGETREEKLARLQDLKEGFYERQIKFEEGRLKGNSEKQLWSCVNRYVRKNRKVTTKGTKKPTLFLVHANGFTREIWEPVLKHLCLAAKGSDVVFDEIWSWEAVNHGDSAVINGENLFPLFRWSDNTRDVLNFIINYMPESVDDSPAPHIPRVTPDASYRRRHYGFKQRELICLGHSFGGTTIIRAAHECPPLFSAILTVDPVVFRPPFGIPWINASTTSVPVGFFMDGSLARREKWASREEALRLFQRHPSFSAWDPETLKVYVECGLQEDADGCVRLKMSRILETSGYVERRSSFEAWEVLPGLDERIALRYILPERVFDGMLRERQEQAWLRPNNTSNTIIKGTGHLVPQEAPEDVAYEIHAFIQKYQVPHAKL